MFVLALDLNLQLNVVRVQVVCRTSTQNWLKYVVHNQVTLKSGEPQASGFHMLHTQAYSQFLRSYKIVLFVASDLQVRSYRT